VAGAFVTRARLAARQLAWAAGPRYVLLDLALALKGGEFVVLSGANGSGKTTLMRLLGGRMRATGGTIALDDAPLPTLDPGYVGRRIGWLGHKPGLYLDLTARENVVLFARIAGAAVSSAEVDELLDTVGLRRADRDRPVRQFSRGMQQRAGLARVMATSADVWLFDEPTTGLDHDGRAMLLQVLRDRADAGIAILVASHNHEVINVADRHLHLVDGRLQDAA